MMLQFDRVELDSESDALRHHVRDFIADNKDHLPQPNSDFVTGHDAEFSRKLGSKGWIGMTWPAQYGGCLLYTSPSPRDRQKSRMPSSA